MKPLESVLDESPPPLPHRWQCDSKFLSDLRIGLSRIGFLTSTGQHDATAQRECLCRLGTPRPSYKRFPLGIRQNQFCFRSCHDTLIPRSFGPHARDDTDNKPAAQGLTNVFMTHNTSLALKLFITDAIFDTKSFCQTRSRITERVVAGVNGKSVVDNGSDHHGRDVRFVLCKNGCGGKRQCNRYQSRLNATSNELCNLHVRLTSCVSGEFEGCESKSRHSSRRVERVDWLEVTSPRSRR